MTAACVSALPSAQCRAIAEVYMHAIDGYGASALAGLMILGSSFVTHPPGVERVQRLVYGTIVYGMLSVGVFGLLVGTIVGQVSLRMAVPICWANTPALLDLPQNR